MTGTGKTGGQTAEIQNLKAVFGSLLKMIQRYLPERQAYIARPLLLRLCESQIEMRRAMASASQALSADSSGVKQVKKASRKTSIGQTDKALIHALLKTSEGEDSLPDALNIILAIHEIDALCSGQVMSFIECAEDSAVRYKALGGALVRELLPLLIRGQALKIRRLMELLAPAGAPPYTKIDDELKRIAGAPDARMPHESLLLLEAYSAGGHSVETVSLANEGQSVRSRQLAMALMAAWEAQNAGADPKQTFESIQSYASNFCSISLYGKVGESGRYDKKLHYGLDLKFGDPIVITQPGVQWVAGVAVEVLLPAHVRRQE